MPKALAAALAHMAEEHIDLDALLALAATAAVPPAPAAEVVAADPDVDRSVAETGAARVSGAEAGAGEQGWRGARVRIGVARDAAFGFYYAECALCDF